MSWINFTCRQIPDLEEGSISLKTCPEIIILLSLYANSDTRKWGFIIHMSSHRHMRSSHSRLKLGKVLSRNWNWRCGDNFMKITVICNYNVPCNYALILAIMSFYWFYAELCEIFGNMHFYDKVRLCAEFDKKCDFVRKFLKCVKSHWPH